MHECEAGTVDARSREQDEPARLEDHLEAEPAAVEVAARHQVLGDDDRIETLELHLHRIRAPGSD